jgi:hypothetical protein
MDSFEKRLKDDANEIRVEVTPQFEARLDASIRAAERRPTTAPAARSSTASLWWASSLTGLAAAMMLIVVLNWNREAPPEVSPVIVAATPSAPTEQILLPSQFALDARTAVLTEPLEAELENLKSDLEKARDSVARDIPSTF